MGASAGPVTMESYLREQADRLVNRLVSERASERQRILDEQDTAGWDAARRQALRDSLRAARLRGRITDAAYEETRVQVERWYAHHDTHEHVRPAHAHPDAPTVELGHAPLPQVGKPRDLHLRPAPPAEARGPRVAHPEPAAPGEPRLLRYPQLPEADPTGDSPDADSVAPVMHSPDLIRPPDETRELPPEATRELHPDATRELHPDATRELPSDATRELHPDSTRELARIPPILRDPPLVNLEPTEEPSAPGEPGALTVQRDTSNVPPEIRARPDPLRSDLPAPGGSARRRVEPKVDVPRRPAEPRPAPPKTPAGGQEASTNAQAATSTGPQFVPGAIIRGRYVIEEQIGAGGSALIFRARDMRRAALEGDGQVALKVPREHLRDREDIASRLKREFHQAQSITHPNVVRVFDIDCEQGTWFLTMELLDGESLATVLSCLQPRRLPAREAQTIVLRCGEALAHAHERGVLHGDFKPGNVFITRNEQVFVLDFGVVEPSPLPRDADPDAKPSQRALAATPCYASPDILSGLAPDERDDVFSLACVVYEVMTGRHPFDRQSTLEARDRRMRVRRAPGLSRRQYNAVERALSWQRRRRWGSVREFLTEFGVYRPARSAWWHATAAGLLGAIAAAALLSWHYSIESRKSSDANSQQAASPERATPTGQAPKVATEAPNRTDVAPGAPAPRDSSAATKPAARAAEPPATSRESTSSPSRTTAPAPSSTQAIAPSQKKGPTTRTFPLTDQETTTAPRPAAAASSPRASGKPGRVSFEQANLVVNERAVSAVVRVRRLEDLRGRLRIQWRAIPGTAIPSQDYSFDGIGTIDIPEGQSVRVLYVPILNDDVHENNESFDVELFAVNGPAEPGPISRATITILDDD